MKKTTILFDLDGTLIDSTKAILESFGVAYETHGTETPDAKDIVALIGHPLDFMFSHLGVAHGEMDSYLNAYKAHYREVSKPKTHLLPNAKEAIVRAAGFARLGVVTTKTARYSEELLDYFGVMGYFEVLIGRESVHHPKPHPEPILKALHLMSANKDFAYMIGDTCLDIIAAQRAEIKSVAVTSGYASFEQLSICTESIVDDALEAVERIFSS